MIPIKFIDDYIVLNRQSCFNDEFSWSVNYEKLSESHPFIKDTWKPDNYPYDFNSIMQYDGTLCQIGSDPVIAYKLGF